MSEFATFARNRGMSVQSFPDAYLLVGYKGRLELFNCAFKGGVGAGDGFPDVLDMLISAHQADDYSQEDFGEYALMNGLNENAAYAWKFWQYSLKCLTLFKILLGQDFDLFVEVALAE